MQQMVSISDARKNLSQLVAQVARQNESIIIIRDSFPEAVIVPYREMFELERQKKAAWNKKWDILLKNGKRQGQKWAKSKKIDLNKMSEQDLYARIKQA